MTLQPLHDPSSGTLRVVGLMSGSGTNLRRIIEHQKRLESERRASPYRVVAIFSDNWRSKATEIGADFDIPVVTSDIRSFYRARRRPRRDLALRAEFDVLTVRLLGPFEATVAAYAGYMSIATAPLLRAFLGVNVHPADLAVEVDGRRRFVGDHAVRDAIVAGEKTLRSSTHIIEEAVDYGRLLMVSAPLEVRLDEDFDPSDVAKVRIAEERNQDRLKERGDWVIFPRTLQYIAEGRYAVDAEGGLHFDGAPIPKGLRLNRFESEETTSMSETVEERRERARRHFEAAEAKQAAGDLEGAMDGYSRAIHLDLEWAQPSLARGSLRQKLGRVDEAIDDYTRAIRIDPGYVRAYAKRGVLYLVKREYEGAENDFSKALAAAPTHAVLLAKRAETRLAMGKGWDALEDAGDLLQAHPEDPEGYYLRGLALEAVADTEGAEKDLREAASRGHEKARQVLRQRYGGV